MGDTTTKLKFHPVLLLALLSVSASAGDLPPVFSWHCLPCGAKPHAELARLKSGFSREGWLPVTFPHQLDRLQPEDDAFAWYAAELTVPPTLAGRDLVLDLGVIDDADVTYVNGTKVGGMGSVASRNALAWNLDRRYLVPATLLKQDEPNLIAVQMRDYGGPGGMFGPPHVGAFLDLPTRSWRCEWAEGEPGWAKPDFDDSKWESVSIPDAAAKLRLVASKYAVAYFCWYRARFDLVPALREGPLVLDLGPVYDACEVWVNGDKVGTVGKPWPDPIALPSERVRVLVPKELLRAENVLAVRCYFHLSQVPAGTDVLPGFDGSRRQGGLGLPGYPAIDFLAPSTPAAAVKLGGDAPLDLAELLLTGNRLSEAEAALSSWREGKGTEEAMAIDFPRGIDLALRLACLQGKKERARELFVAYVKANPFACPSLETVSWLARLLADERLDPGVLWVGENPYTSGDWRHVYGNHGYVLCGWNYQEDVVHYRWPGKPFKRKDPTASAYAVRILAEGDFARSWVGVNRTKDPRVLYLGPPSDPYRRYACWDDHGEIHPFDEQGPNLLVDLDIPAGEFFLSFYFLDYDWYNGEHPRAQSTLLVDRETRAPLAVAPTGRFGEGVFQTFWVKGPRQLTARLNKHRSACAVVSGVFLDRVPREGMKRDPEALYVGLENELTKRFLKRLADVPR